MESATERFLAYAATIRESRGAPRFATRIPTGIRAIDDTIYHAEVIDISTSGFAARLFCPLNPGSRCWIHLPGVSEQEAEVIINDGSILRCAFHSPISEAALKVLLSAFATEPGNY